MLLWVGLASVSCTARIDPPDLDRFDAAAWRVEQNATRAEAAAQQATGAARRSELALQRIEMSAAIEVSYRFDIGGECGYDSRSATLTWDMVQGEPERRHLRLTRAELERILAAAHAVNFFDVTTARRSADAQCMSATPCKMSALTITTVARQATLGVGCQYDCPMPATAAALNAVDQVLIEILSTRPAYRMRPTPRSSYR
ncbi:MAG: hypothetical protein SF182_06235 [Deltaproteobacteria bacterium]|nr:hypothetical protein [Deltaproteobacteria bacterium]